MCDGGIFRPLIRRDRKEIQRYFQEENMSSQTVNWKDYAPAATSRVREMTEWSTT